MVARHGSTDGGSVIRVLLVEDDKAIAGRLLDGLAEAGFVTDHIENGEDACAMGRDHHYDVAILDLGLPGLGGLGVLEYWRGSGRNFPVLILTAQGSWSEKVKGLNAGADDYIGKPFHMLEIIARIHALVRRSAGVSHPVLTHKDVTLDTIAGRVYVAGHPVSLTAHELRMLSYFLLRPGRLVSQRDLAQHLYTLDAEAESNTIEVYVARLRKKLGKDFITTLRGLGYRLD